MTSLAPARHKPFVGEVLGRSDYAIIGELIEPKTRVLDLGCGEGELLDWLSTNKSVMGRGVELDSTRVQRAIARGVSAYQGDIDQGLADYPPDSFDYAILSQTLQETRRPLVVLRDMLRVARNAVITFPNFGHWSVRLSHLVSGRAPKTRIFPHDGFDSPNIHFFTVLDFEDLVAREGWTIERRYFLSGHRLARLLPNLMAEVAVYLVRR